MNKQQEALKLALEALEQSHPEAYRHTITAIRNALADSALDRMAENAREIGLDYGPIVERVEDSIGMGNGAWDMVEPKELAKAFHEALAEQPAQQEPVAWITKNGKGWLRWHRSEDSDKNQDSIPLYTSPQPTKPWVGLTDEEYSQLHDGLYQQGKSLGWVVDQVEAKLREKNA